MLVSTPHAFPPFGEGGAEAPVEFDAAGLPLRRQMIHPAVLSAGFSCGVIRMFSRGGELPAAAAPICGARIALAKASAAGPSTDCPGGIGVGTAATAASVII
jgi:hypothetical protein